MKKNLTSILILLLITLSRTMYAQTPGWAWADGAGGTADEAGQSLCTDGSGNVYVTGFYRSPSITFGSFTLTNTDATETTNDMFVVKIDAFNNVLWAKNIGGMGDEEGTGICADRQGNVYVAGNFTSQSITLAGDTLNNANTSSFAINDDIMLLKYAPSGTLLWAKSAGGYGDDKAAGVATNGDNMIYVTGSFDSDSIRFNSDSLFFSAGGLDIYITKYDSLGNVVWAQTTGGIDDDISSAISCDTIGNIAITGNFFSDSIMFGSFTLNKKDTISTDTTRQANDVFVTKYNTAGTALWAKSAGGTPINFDNVSSNSIAMDATGDLYITGYFRYDTLTFGSTQLIGYDSILSRNIFVTKYDNTGNVAWAKGYGDVGDNEGRGITVDAAGEILITGYFQSGTLAFDSVTLTATSFDSEIFVVKYDSLGNVIWGLTAGGASGEFGNSISTYQNNNVFITGQYYSSPAHFGVYPLTNAGDGDIFISKIFPETVGIHGNKDAKNELGVYPNPSNSFSIIYYSLQTPATVSMDIYNDLGEKIYSVINNEKQSAGDYRYIFNASQSGIYFIKLQTEEGVLIKKVVVSK